MRVHIKSQFGAEFRRYSVVIGTGLALPSLEEFLSELFSIHKLTEEQREAVTVSYVEKDGTNLPISNDENLHKALNDKPNMLRINIQNKGESYEEQFGYGLSQKSIEQKKRRALSISSPLQDFRRVSSILDADTLPTELRRVQLCKAFNNKPLGFYIRDGHNYHFTPDGPILGSGIFISRLLPHGLAASTNILKEGDEILEVNGISVRNKTLDQVTDIMHANARNLILTTRPAIHYQPPPPPLHYYNSLPPPYSFPTPVYNTYGMMSMHYSPINSRHQMPSIHSHHPSHYYPPSSHPMPHTLYNQENLDDKYRISSPMEAYHFSRESTYRLSDKTAKLTLNESNRTPRRPMSMHPGFIYPPSRYGYNPNMITNAM